MAIKVSNIYYMLAYAFQSMTAGSTMSLGNEDFENLHTLFAEIILRGMNRQIKRGISRDYSPRIETLTSVRGKIDITKTINGMTHLTRQLVCEYDEFTEDILPNRVIKAAITVLLRHGDLPVKSRYGLKRIHQFLSGVKDLNRSEIRFDFLKSARMSIEYKMIVSVCRLLFENLLMTEENGEQKLRSYLPDEKMSQLYERFVREYYRYHHHELFDKESKINWDLNEDTDIANLPSMWSDTRLSHKGKTLIIDTKWYSRTMAVYFGKSSYHSSNLYQIYSYVNNFAKGTQGNVAGVLLYAKTDEPVPPDDDFPVSGNRIIVKALDLSQSFEVIRTQLDEIAGIMKSQELVEFMA